MREQTLQEILQNEGEDGFILPRMGKEEVFDELHEALRSGDISVRDFQYGLSERLELEELKDVTKAIELLATLRSGIFTADKETVIQLQEGLIADGYDLGRAGADGIIGEKTMPAILDFSIDHAKEIADEQKRLERKEKVEEIHLPPTRER